MQGAGNPAKPGTSRASRGPPRRGVDAVAGTGTSCAGRRSRLQPHAAFARCARTRCIYNRPGMRRHFPHSARAQGSARGVGGTFPRAALTSVNQGGAPRHLPAGLGQRTAAGTTAGGQAAPWHGGASPRAGPADAGQPGRIQKHPQERQGDSPSGSAPPRQCPGGLRPRGPPAPWGYPRGSPGAVLVRCRVPKNTPTAASTVARSACMLLPALHWPCTDKTGDDDPAVALLV